MTLAYFYGWHTFKEKFLKAHYLGDCYSYTATLSCTVIGSEWSSGVDGICDLDLREKGQNVLTYFSFSGSSMAMTWPRTLIFGSMADVREPLQSLLYGPPWPTFATHLNNGLRPYSAYTAVVRLPTTAALLVRYAVDLLHTMSEHLMLYRQFVVPEAIIPTI